MSARIHKLNRPWVAAAAMAAVAGGLSAVSPPSHAGVDPELVCPRSTTTETVAEPERLITKFDLTVFRIEFETHQKVLDVVRKWAGQVRVGFVETPDRYRALVGRVVHDLSCLTGLQVDLQEEPRLDSNFLVIMSTRDDLDAYAREKQVDVESLTSLFCTMTPGLEYAPREANEPFAAIGVVDFLSEAETRHCFVRLMTRALGLFADSDVVQPSVFSADGAKLDHLPINDKIILRTLYDPRIERGMKREDAMEIVRQIIPELVKAVRERGVEALYRR
ncbi:MAG: DUF2927 domain-containing protein [Proteobacteria bacterium]|nr:DUF2927 domain-containing protein [Pseudomonadota bacterium]